MFVKARVHVAVLCFCLSVAASSVALAQHEGHGHAPAGQASQQPFSGDPFLLDTDAVTGEKLGLLEKQVVVEYEGRELRFNSDESVRTFRSNPAKFLAEVDAALVQLQLPFYPLEACPVSGGELGEMGAPVDFVYRNRLVRFCCKGCKPKFLEDPHKFVAKLDAAVIAAQRPKYPLKTCIVSGEELGGAMGQPIDYVIGNRLVRLCCEGCKKKIVTDPLSYLAKLDPANAEEGHGEKGHDHATAGQASQQPFSGDPYLLDTDAVTGEKLGPLEKQVVVEEVGVAKLPPLAMPVAFQESAGATQQAGDEHAAQEERAHDERAVHDRPPSGAEADHDDDHDHSAHDDSASGRTKTLSYP